MRALFWVEQTDQSCLPQLEHLEYPGPEKREEMSAGSTLLTTLKEHLLERYYKTTCNYFS